MRIGRWATVVRLIPSGAARVSRRVNNSRESAQIAAKSSKSDTRRARARARTVRPLPSGPPNGGSLPLALPLGVRNGGSSTFGMIHHSRHRRAHNAECGEGNIEGDSAAVGDGGDEVGAEAGSDRVVCHEPIWIIIWVRRTAISAMSVNDPKQTFVEVRCLRRARNPIVPFAGCDEVWRYHRQLRMPRYVRNPWCNRGPRHACSPHASTLPQHYLEGQNW
jgi:hypothetical protein